jgi:hypothetical protein
MTQFVFLYRRREEEMPSPEQMQERMQKWMAWFSQLNEAGAIKDKGLPLERTGKVIRGVPKRNVTDGPYAEKDLVMGFTLVEARDLAHAVELSSGCPILQEATGALEVRPVMQMNG